MHSRIKLFGHPIHPMLVGYPVALYTATLVAYAIYAGNADPFWFKFAVVVNLAGVGMAVLTALPGFLDWALGIPAGSEAKRTGLAHMGLNLLALGLFAANLGIHVHGWADTQPTGATSGIVLAALGILATLAAGFLGWALVQDHGVGVSIEAGRELRGERQAQRQEQVRATR
jgi:uncharacterized membrane protein